jgi:PAS domain S-box-containing protein
MQCNRQTTDRQRGEQALRDHEAGLRHAQQMAKLAHVITGAAGEFLTWSETLPTMIGRDAAAMPGSTRAWLELLHPEDRERVRRIMIQAAKTGSAAVLEYRLQRLPGESVHIRQVIEPLDSEQDPKEGRRLFNTLQDVTAEKLAAQTLLASEERYRATFEQAAVGIGHSSLEGELRLVNQTFCVMTGYSRAEALQFNIRDISHPHDIGTSTEGRMKIMEGSGTPYQREPVESIFLTDPKTMRFLYVNDTACRKLGYTREQLLQKAPSELIGKTREQLSSEDDEVIAAGERGTRRLVPDDRKCARLSPVREKWRIESGRTAAGFCLRLVVEEARRELDEPSSTLVYGTRQCEQTRS